MLCYFRVGNDSTFSRFTRTLDYQRVVVLVKPPRASMIDSKDKKTMTTGTGTTGMSTSGGESSISPSSHSFVHQPLTAAQVTEFLTLSHTFIKHGAYHHIIMTITITIPIMPFHSSRRTCNHINMRVWLMYRS